MKRRPSILLTKRDISNAYNQSDSSGSGSAEGETAEDQEIKWINEYPRQNRDESVQGKQDAEIEHSTVPGDISPVTLSTWGWSRFLINA